MKYHLHRIFLLISFFSCCLSAGAQMSIGPNTPSPHAMLDLSSSQKGMLLPRLNAAQQAALKATLGAGQEGMLVLDSASGKIVYWTGNSTTSWKDLSTATVTTASPLSISSINNIALNPGTAAGDLITWDGNNWVNMQPALHFNITVDNRQPSLVLNYCIAVTGIFPSRSENDPYLSELNIYSFGLVPKGWAACNGQLLNINSNSALFSLLGTTYGGNGVNNFGLPNLQGRVPLHAGNGAGLSPYVLGQTGGTEHNTITQ